MSFWTYTNRRIKSFSLLDLALIQIAVACFTILVIKFRPEIIIINKWWFIGIFLFVLLRPLYRFFVEI
ncbi:MAG: hypothetical protein NG737_05300 [Omnitrophica bacterium]|nr:hypothetical protein [Candidatus Omnitrophota bacterium]